ncbi:MAG: adenosylcobinamide-GDP ribazoletransferase [Thermoplasmata archaeon]
MIDYISSIISFFSRIPGKSDINKASKISYLLPFLGILFGFIFSLFAILLMFIPKIIYSLIVIIFIYLILGLLHLDGLADFSDGVMAKGSLEKKIKALKDVNTGIAGTFSVLIVILTEIFSLYNLKLNYFNIFSFFILSELSAKFSMLFGLYEKVYPSGIGEIFFKNFRPYYLFIGVIYTVPLILIFHFYYFISYIGILVSFVIKYISLKNFGFVNGDVIGAMNEISRSITMVVLCLVL